MPFHLHISGPQQRESGPSELQRLALIAQGSGVTEAEIVAEFARVTREDVALLHRAADAADFRQVGLLAHRMKGASMMLGATGFADACALVSAASHSLDPAALTAALASLDRHVAHLDPWVDGHGASVPADAAADATPAPPCTELRFMVVEDHDFQRGVIMRLLERLGAREVQGFADGESALEALTEPACGTDIMVLDLSLPGMGGLELIGKIGQARHPVAVILNSALSPTLLAARLQLAGSHPVRLLGTIGKPLTEAALAPLVALYRSGPVAHP